MINTTLCRALKNGAAALICVASFAATAAAAGPQIVGGPAGDPKCYIPWTASTKFFKFPKKAGPYRVALANG
jgi:ribose transport system substrate-binding protein